MLICFLQWRGQLPQQRNFQHKLSVVLRLRGLSIKQADLNIVLLITDFQLFDYDRWGGCSAWNLFSFLDLWAYILKKKIGKFWSLNLQIFLLLLFFIIFLGLQLYMLDHLKWSHRYLMNHSFFFQYFFCFM